MDPLSGLDAVRDVGIRDGRIEAISEAQLEGAQVVPASGLVVTPGFIDLHRHGQTEEAYRSMVLAGVTTGLELEIGTDDVDSWYAAREPGQVVNYGVSVGHVRVRMNVMGEPMREDVLLPSESGPAAKVVASNAQLGEMADLIDAGLRQGALAIGFALAYTPGATREEFVSLLQAARPYNVAAHVHIRAGLEGLREALDATAEVGIPLHVVHVNSSGGPDTGEFLRLIGQAAAHGQDVTTEAYPYEAGVTQIDSVYFEGWESWEDDRFQAVQWVDTGERLTRESFERYRQQGGRVIVYSRTEEMTRTAIESPLAMIASDGRVFNGSAHPRSTGTYSKVLGRYVREQGSLGLMEALRRMTIAPARRLEARAPTMANKGRISVGADADLTIFDPQTVIDRSTYEDGTTPPEGIEFVAVNGVIVVEHGELVEGATPGRAVRAAP